MVAGGRRAWPVGRGHQAGERPELLDEVRLVEVAGAVGDLGPVDRPVVGDRCQRPLETAYPAKRFGVNPTLSVNRRVNARPVSPQCSATCATGRPRWSSPTANASPGSARSGRTARRSRTCSTRSSFAPGVGAAASRSRRSAPAFAPQSTSRPSSCSPARPAGPAKNAAAPPGRNATHTVSRWSAVSITCTWDRGPDSAAPPTNVAGRASPAPSYTRNLSSARLTSSCGTPVGNARSRPLPAFPSAYPR